MPPGGIPAAIPKRVIVSPVMRAMPPAPLWPIQIEPSRAPSSAATVWSAARHPLHAGLPPREDRAVEADQPVAGAEPEIAVAILGDGEDVAKRQTRLARPRRERVARLPGRRAGRAAIGRRERPCRQREHRDDRAGTQKRPSHAPTILRESRPTRALSG